MASTFQLLTAKHEKKTYNEFVKDIVANFKKNPRDAIVTFERSALATEWFFTIPGAVEAAYAKSLIRVRAVDELQDYLSPLYTSASFGLPAALSQDEVDTMNETALLWIEAGLPFTWVRGDISYVRANLPETLVEAIVNVSVPYYVFKIHMKELIEQEWARVLRWDLAKIYHLDSAPVLHAVDSAFAEKQRLLGVGVESVVCPHNLLRMNDCQSPLFCPICQ